MSVQRCRNVSKRLFLLTSSYPKYKYSYSTTFPSKPWFVSEEDETSPLQSIHYSPQTTPIHALPPNTPFHLQTLYDTLQHSPFLERGHLRVTPSGTEETTPVPAPPLPSVRPKGRRRTRGGTDFGPGVDIPLSTVGSEVWTWLLFAQIKEGLNRKVATNQLLRSCKKSLPYHHFHLSRDSKGSNESTDGWTLIDAGDFAIHILDSQAKQTWFPRLNL